MTTATRCEKVPFDDPDFIAELKHDGLRALAYIESGSCRLISRKQIVYKSKPFLALCTLLAELPVRDAILDGELVVLDSDGRSQFMELMRRETPGCLLLRLRSSLGRWYRSSPITIART